MKTVESRLASVLILLACSTMSQAAADRESLLAAWETHLRQMPSTVVLEAEGDGAYHFEDSDLPYDGTLRVISAIVRSSEVAGYDSGFPAMGIVEFWLDDLPEERLGSQGYYYWLADRQMLHYLEAEDRWIDASAYQQLVASELHDNLPYSTSSWLLGNGIWILLVALIVFAFVTLRASQRKARKLMDETADINRKARENLDRSERMQQEVLAIAGESRDLHRETNGLLRKLLAAQGDGRGEGR